jgi:maleylpyruvate isomerase
MYVSPERRAAGIEQGALLPAIELRDWIARSADALDADFTGLPEGAWDATVITAQGLTRSAREIPWMRVREVYVHTVDLDAEITFADLPPSFLAALLDDVTARRSSVGTGPALTAIASDIGDAWQVSGVGKPHEIAAPLSALAEWLTGRSAAGLKEAAGTPSPTLPPWL